MKTSEQKVFSMNKIQSKYNKQAMLFSALFHLLLGAIMMVIVVAKNKYPQAVVISPPSNDEPIHAVAVDEQAVMARVAAIKAQNLNKTLQAHQQQQRLRIATQAIEKERKQNELQLAHLKNQQAQLLKNQQKTIEAFNEKMQAMKIAAAAERNKQAELAAKAKQQAFEIEKAAHQQQVMAHYIGLIRQAISRHWQVNKIDDQLSCILAITLSPTGEVTKVSLIRSSGDPILDRTAQAAVYKASPLPLPNEPELKTIFHEIRLTLRPQQQV